MERDRNLLFGILAVQLKGVPAEKIIEAGALWATDTSRPLSDRIRELGLLTEADCEIINLFIEEAVKAHGGDATKALSEIAGSERLTRTLQFPSGNADETRKMVVSFFAASDELVDAAEEIPGRYSQISEYARGGMGRVLLVHDAHMGRHIALKELLPNMDIDSSTGKLTPVRHTAAMASRFLQEARITGQLEHPSIVPVYELGRRADGTLYYTMKLVRGKTMSQCIRGADSLQKRLELLPNFLDLCNAIAYAHDRGVIHRDIKPSNVMIGEFGETVVLDWGLAKARDVEDVFSEDIESTTRSINLGESEYDSETAYGKAVGTPNYMPPEQAEGRVDEIDERSDVYSLGAVLFEILTGEPPHKGKSVHEILFRVINDPHRKVTDFVQDAPPELIGICEKALQRQRADRYDTAKTLAADIRAFQSGALVQAYRYNSKEMLKRFYNKNRRAVQISAAACFLLLSLGVVSFISIYSARNLAVEKQLAAEQAERIATVAREDQAKETKIAKRKNYVLQIRQAYLHLTNHNYDAASEVLWTADEDQRHVEWGYLMSKANPDLFTVRSDTSTIHAALFSPDGSKLLIVSYPDPPSIVDAATGKLLASFKGPYEPPLDIVFRPDSEEVAASCQDGFLRVWNCTTGELHCNSDQTKGMLQSVAYSKDGKKILTSCADHALRIFDATTLLPLVAIDVGAGVSAAQFNSDETMILCSVDDGTVQLWDLASRTMHLTVPGTLGRFSPDAQRIATIVGNKLNLYESQSGRLIAEMGGISLGIFKFKFNDSGTRIATASLDGTARVWSCDTGKEIVTFPNNSAVIDIHFLNDDKQVLVCSSDNTYNLFESASKRLMRSIHPLGHVFNYMSINKRNNTMAMASSEHSCSVWPIMRPGIGRILTERKDGSCQSVASSDLHYLALSQEDSLKIIDLLDHHVQLQLGSVNHGREMMAFSPNGNYFAYCCDNSVAQVWDVLKARLLLSIAPPGAQISAIAFDHNHIAVGLTSGEVLIENVETKTLDATLKGNNAGIVALAYSSDAARLASVDDDSAMIVWDVPSATAARRYDIGEGPVSSAAWTTDNARVLVGTAKGALLQIDPSGGTSQIPMAGQEEEINLILPVADSNTVITCSSGRTCFWDLEERALLFNLPTLDLLAVDTKSRRLIEVGLMGDANLMTVAPWNASQFPAGTTSQADAFAIYKKTQNEAPPITLAAASVEERAVPVNRVEQGISFMVDKLVAAPGNDNGKPVTIGPELAKGSRLLGVRDGDLLTGMNGSQISSANELGAALKQINTNDAQITQKGIELEIVRAGQPRKIHLNLNPMEVRRQEITLSAGLAKDFFSTMLTNARNFATQPDATRTVLDTILLDVTDRMGTPRDVDLYKKCGLFPRDRITGVNGRSLHSVEELVNELETFVHNDATDKSIELDIMRGDFVTIKETYKI